MKMLRRIIAACLAVAYLVITVVAFPGIDAAATDVPRVMVSEISFKRAGTGELTLYKGQSYKLGTTITPANATNKKVQYSLSKRNILSVTSGGKIKALETGSVYLTAKSVDNSKKKAKIKINVIPKKEYKKIKTILPGEKYISLSVSQSTAISVTIKPKKASNKNLKYKSANPQVVTVSNSGIMKALQAGTTKITMQTLDGTRKKAIVKVTITPEHRSQKTGDKMPKTPKDTTVLLPAAEYMNLEIDQKDATITEIHPSLTGKYETNGNIKSISYTIADAACKAGEFKSGGNAIIGTDTWEIARLELSPGVNRITVKAETYNGITAEQTITLTYQRGSLDHEPDLIDVGGIVVDASGNIQLEEPMETEEEISAVPYVKNRLLVYFEEGTDVVRRNEIFDTIGAKVIGSLNTIDLYQIELPVKYETIEELEVYGETLCSTYPEIVLTEPEWVIFEPEDTIYNDSWDSALWNVRSPSGTNWWAEAVNAPLAWSYASKMTPVRIGVVDNGFDVSHEDLQIQFSNSKREKENSTETHGTHVAGIIGATANNIKGLTGLAWMNSLYAYDWQPASGQFWLTTTKIKDLYIEAIEDGCKVVTMSLGNSGSLKDNTKKYSKARRNLWGKGASFVLGKLLERGFDFVVVQSAGNGASDQVGVDAANNGEFSSITKSNCYKSRKVTKNDILNRILIVGAAERNGNGYQQTYFSNGGSNVNITAPGSSIYSTLPENAYGELSGTSMAAPIVAATASMIWSVHQEFTGADVQKILLGTADQIAYDNKESKNTTGDIPMVNTGEAVKEAIECGGTIFGFFTNAANGKNMQASYIIHKESATGEVVGNAAGYASKKDGTFTISNLSAGTYVLEIKAKNFVTNFATIEVPLQGNTDIGTISLTKKLNAKTYRIVLTWGDSIGDLDAHLRGTDSENNDVHIYHISSNQGTLSLDVDDTSSYGPETITIKNIEKFRNIRYAVHNYTDGEADSKDKRAIRLAESGATVKVYKGSSLLKTYEVPQNIKGTLWTVFSIARNGEILDINSMGYESEPSKVLD